MKWFKDSKISKKLAVMTICVAIITAIVCAVGLQSILFIAKSDSDLYAHNTLSLDYSGSAAVNLQQLRYLARETAIRMMRAVMDCVQICAIDAKGSFKLGVDSSQPNLVALTPCKNRLVRDQHHAIFSIIEPSHSRAGVRE
jgi:hypothetical protein